MLAKFLLGEILVAAHLWKRITGGLKEEKGEVVKQAEQ